MFDNWFFFVAVVGSIGLQILLMEVPILSMLLDLTTVSYGMLGILLLISFSAIIISELLKYFKRKFERQGKMVR